MVYSKNDTSLYLCPKDHSTRKEINCLLTVDAMTAMKKNAVFSVAVGRSAASLWHVTNG